MKLKMLKMQTRDSMTGQSKGFDTPADLLFCNFDYHNAILNYSISVKNQVYMCYDNVNICRSGHTFRFSLDQGFFYDANRLY